MNLKVQKVESEEIAEMLASEESNVEILYAGQGLNLHKKKDVDGRTVLMLDFPAGECLTITLG